MNSELEILKKIWGNKEETFIRVVSQQTKFGIDYVRYICNCLVKKGQVKAVKGKRDCYKITPKGKKELKLRQIIKSKVSRRKKGIKVEKVVLHLPKKLKTKPPERDSKIKLVEAEEKKFNLGRSIERAVSFLKGK